MVLNIYTGVLYKIGKHHIMQNKKNHRRRPKITT